MIRCLLLLLSVGLLARPSAAQTETGRTILKLKEGEPRPMIAALAQSIDAQIVNHTPGVPYLLVRPKKGSQQLAMQHLPDSVEFSEPERRISLKRGEGPGGRISALQGPATPNDSYFERQWNMQDSGYGIGLPTARLRARGKGVVVAILDTGIRKELSDLAGTAFLPGFNALNNSTNTNDDQGHGSHVCGTIAQTTDNALGCAGVAPEVSVIPVKVLDANGSGSNYSVSVGLRWAADHGAQVINLSLGGAASQTIADAVSYCGSKGIVICAASGNQGKGQVLYPAALPGCISVGAVTAKGARAPFSNWGDPLSLVAPGSSILQQTWNPKTKRAGYGAWAGTSMATPHVAGTAALLLGINPNLTPTEIRDILLGTARDLGAPGRDAETGAGLLNAAAAVARLAGANPIPVPTPTPIPEPPPIPVPPSEIQQVLDRVNQERTVAGVPALAIHEALSKAAQGHAEDMAAKGYFSHYSQDGRSPGDRIAAVGYTARTWGENIAWGQRAPAAVMDAWMNSAGHRANILNSAFREIGIGLARNSSGAPYWVQTFGARR